MGAHLDELVQGRVSAGEAVAARLTEHAEKILTPYAEREAIAREISGLVAMVTPTSPGLVSFTRCEALAAEAKKLIQQGGEDPPALRRERLPQLFGEPAEAAA